MARSTLTDPLQSFRFWLVDISPNLNPPFFALDPTAGFRACSAVEIQVTHSEYRPLNAMEPEHFIEASSVGPITLQRGARVGKRDFYRWITRHQQGIDATRRNLLLVHSMGARLGRAVAQLPFGPTIGDGSILRVPARAWLLKGCVPTRYSTGDFDASSSEVSIQELEIQPHKVVQIDLGLG